MRDYFSKKINKNKKAYIKSNKNGCQKSLKSAPKQI